MVKVIFSTLILPHQYFMDLINFRVTVVWEIIIQVQWRLLKQSGGQNLCVRDTGRCGIRI